MKEYAPVVKCSHKVIRGGYGVKCGYVFEGQLDRVNGKVCYVVGEEVTLQTAQIICPECGAIFYHDYRAY